jgi:hypothetical protein
MKSRKRSYVLAFAITVLLGTSATASVINAVEPNNTFATAQVISGSSFSLDFDPNIGTGSGAGFVNTSTSIPHVTILAGNNPGGYDFYRFTVLIGGLAILDIDSDPFSTNFDTELFLFDAAGAGIASNDDNGGDPGDLGGGAAIGGAFNSRIERVLPAGDYVVGVAQFNSNFGTNPGEISGPTIFAGGQYTLHISANAMTVPEPATLLLFGAAVAGVVASTRRARRRGERDDVV